jgi:hypothetical protein
LRSKCNLRRYTGGCGRQPGHAAPHRLPELLDAAAAAAGEERGEAKQNRAVFYCFLHCFSLASVFGRNSFKK